MNRHMDEAIEAYVAKRRQMGAAKAAAHVIQAFGITATQLKDELTERELLLNQRVVHEGIVPSVL